MALQVVVDRNLCVGSGSCELIDPDIFKLDRDGKSRAVDSPVEETASLVEAIESCPTGAISAVDENTGAQVHPSW